MTGGKNMKDEKKRLQEVLEALYLLFLALVNVDF